MDDRDFYELAFLVDGHHIIIVKTRWDEATDSRFCSRMSDGGPRIVRHLHTRDFGIER